MGFAEIDGLRVHYRGDPHARRGHRVLYVHGTGCSARVWDRHREVIARHHAAVAIDLPGHGESGGRGFRGVADYAHYATGLAESFGWQRFVLAGHSLGGGIALAAALYGAESVAGLLLIDSGARLRVDPVVLDLARRAAAGEAVAPDPRLGFAPATPQAAVDAVWKQIGAADPQVTYRDWIADDTCDLMSRVASIGVPTLALCGEADSLTPPKYHRFLSRHMPRCRLVVIRGAGHWPMVEQPDAFDAAVAEFLKALPA